MILKRVLETNEDYLARIIRFDIIYSIARSEMISSITI